MENERCPRCDQVQVTCLKDATPSCCLMACEGLSDDLEAIAVQECNRNRALWFEALLVEALPIVSHFEVAHEHNGLAKRIQAALDRK